jgi:hypothetical protein
MEGIGDANNNYGGNADKDDNDNNDNNNNDNNNNGEDDNNKEMGRIPAAGHAGSASRSACARHSPPRPAVVPAAAAAANVDQLVAILLTLS